MKSGALAKKCLCRKAATLFFYWRQQKMDSRASKEGRTRRREERQQRLATPERSALGSAHLKEILDNLDRSTLILLHTKLADEEVDYDGMRTEDIIANMLDLIRDMDEEDREEYLVNVLAWLNKRERLTMVVRPLTIREINAIFQRGPVTLRAYLHSNAVSDADINRLFDMGFKKLYLLRRGEINDPAIEGGRDWAKNFKNYFSRKQQVDDIIYLLKMISKINPDEVRLLLFLWSGILDNAVRTAFENEEEEGQVLSILREFDPNVAIGPGPDGALELEIRNGEQMAIVVERLTQFAKDMKVRRTLEYARRKFGRSSQQQRQSTPSIEGSTPAAEGREKSEKQKRAKRIRQDEPLLPKIPKEFPSEEVKQEFLRDWFEKARPAIYRMEQDTKAALEELKHASRVSLLAPTSMESQLYSLDPSEYVARYSLSDDVIRAQVERIMEEEDESSSDTASSDEEDNE